MDLFIIVLSFVWIIMFTYRTSLVSSLTTKLQHVKKNEFINYQHLFVIEDGLNAVAGILLCLTTMRLWKLLRLGQVFQKLELAVIYSMVPLLLLFFCQLITMLGFACSGYILFGSHSRYFNGISNAMCTLFYLSLRLYKSFDYRVFSGVFGTLYYILFVIVTVTIYIMYAVIIIFARFKCEEYHSKKKVITSARGWTFLREELLYYWNILGLSMLFKKRDMQSDDYFRTSRPAHVHPKRNATRYRNCTHVSTRTMEAMEAVVKATIINSLSDKNSDDEPDYELMEDVVKKMRLMEEEKERGFERSNELFLVTKDRKADKRELVDDRELRTMKNITEQMYPGVEVEDAPPCADQFKEIKRSLNVIRKTFENIHVTLQDEQ